MNYFTYIPMHEKHTFKQVREPIWSRGSGVQRFGDAGGPTPWLYAPKTQV